MEKTYLETFSEHQGWSPQSQVMILLRYIENLEEPERFYDFLQKQADQENRVE